MNEELAIALWPGDRRRDERARAKAVASGALDGALEDLAVDRGVADDAVVGAPPAGLELRLDQGDDRGRGPGPERRGDGTKNEGQGDEGHIDDGQLDRLAEGVRRQETGVRPVVNDDPRIPGDSIGEQASPNVDRVDPGSVPLEQHVTEAPRRRSGIEADETGRIDPERVEGRGELVAPAADVRIALDEPDREIGIDQVAGLPIEPGAVAGPGPDLAREDQSLRPGAAVRQAALDDELVEALAAATSVGVAHPAIVAQPTSRRLTMATMTPR